jgi:hypothetical protein
MMKKKLVLHRETLRHLSGPNLTGVRGGTIVEPTGASYCILCGVATSDCPQDTKKSNCADCEI